MSWCESISSFQNLTLSRLWYLLVNMHVFRTPCPNLIYILNVYIYVYIYKNIIYLLKLCIYSSMFKLQSPLKYSPFDAVHLLRRFFHRSRQFLNLLSLMPFSTSAVFCFTSSTLTKRVPLRTFFIEETKNVILGDRWWIGRAGHKGHPIFGQKLLNTQHSMGRCSCKSPIMKWANVLKESLEKFHWSRMQPLTTMPAGTLIQMGS